MRIRNVLTAFILTVLAFQTAFSQSPGFSAPASAPAHKPGELIIRLTPGSRIEQVVRDINALPVSEGSAGLARPIVSEWRYYLISFDESRVNAYTLAGACAGLPGVESAQLNNQLEYRGVEPNDPDWYQQSDMTLINAPDAWLSSTGGLTSSGDTIVVAVLEKGALFNHPDLATNRYWNWNDWPDGLDNDNNGFPDDFGGWDVANYNDGTGNNGAHGTGVCGIIGAEGNNGVGVTGVNWKVKIMNVSGVEYDDDIIEAYHYVYVVRKQYNESNGAKGAFIVATNASFGYNNQFPDSNPNFTTWCQLYDTLGYVGVLNMGATSNQDVNVDTDGDMPTSCPSEFLVTVTNVNKLGSRVPSGYGKISIDLGAPGTGTYSTTNAGNNTPGYGTIGGTSAATPHVTGAVALLYSMGCESFTGDAVSNPVACARRIRDVILNNTAPNPTLKDITTTGGNLDLKLALGGITKLCEGKVGPLSFLKIRNYQDNNIVRLYYQTPLFFAYNFRVFNALGQLMYEDEIIPDQFSENYVEFDTSDLPGGVYMYTISRGETVASVKVVKN
jgi:subtilisin family serine protease